MCTIDSIKLQVMVFIWLKLTVYVYVFALGIYLASSTDLSQAFGVEFVSHGLSLIFLALLSMGLILPQKYAVNRHNRFLLAFSFIFDTIVFAEMINYSVIINSYTVSEFPKDLQEDCLRNEQLIYTEEDCEDFYAADRTAGLRLMWATYFSDKDDKISFQVLDSIQRGTCCGFFQPFRCIQNKSQFPDDRLQEGVSADLLKQIVSCGEYENFYPEQDNCADFFDFAADPPIIGGCEYDLGVGNCIDDDVQASLIGCASAIEDYVVTLIAAHPGVLIICALVSLQFMTYSACMWWKRKESDVFPSFVTETNVSMRYRNVKDQFEVIPKRDLLVKEGFLPAPEKFGDVQFETTDNDLDSLENGDSRPSDTLKIKPGTKTKKAAAMKTMSEEKDGDVAADPEVEVEEDQVEDDEAGDVDGDAKDDNGSTEE